MTPPRAYLDWNATAPLLDEAREALVQALDAVGNPSSVHAEGRAARRLVEAARKSVADLVGATPSEIVFTSGASEANATVVGQSWTGIAFGNIEHDSVVMPARAAAGASIHLIDVARDGRLDLAALARHFATAAGTSAGEKLLSLQFANNETGVVQPVAEAAAMAKAQGWRVHVDVVQAVGRIAVDAGTIGADYLTISSHKIGGPKGAGALVVRNDAPLTARIAGGGQERRRRAGTEAVAVIAGFGAAARIASAGLKGYAAPVAALRDRLEAELLRRTPGAVIVGADAPRLANTSLVASPDRNAETLVMALDLAGIAISSGAACSSGKVGESRVLDAMGVPRDVARRAVRISIGPTTTDTDIAAFLAAWDDHHRHRAAHAA